jgi:hypothetical protein
MSDIRRVFDGKRVLFAGDSTIRSIYRDMAIFLVSGRLLCPTSAAFQNGEKPLVGGKESKYLLSIMQLLFFSIQPMIVVCVLVVDPACLGTLTNVFVSGQSRHHSITSIFPLLIVKNRMSSFV